MDGDDSEAGLRRNVGVWREDVRSGTIAMLSDMGCKADNEATSVEIAALSTSC
jgi:hypothetical protein